MFDAQLVQVSQGQVNLALSDQCPIGSTRSSLFLYYLCDKRSSDFVVIVTNKISKNDEKKHLAIKNNNEDPKALNG